MQHVSQAGALTLSAVEFEDHVRKKHVERRIPGPCVYDVNEANILSSPQGSWDLVLSDLNCVFGSLPNAGCKLIVAIESVCKDMGIQKAFAFRRELINFKKVCQHVYINSKQLETHLKQLTTYCFSDAVTQERSKLGFQKSVRYAEISSTMSHVKGSSCSIQDIRFYLKSICCVPRHPSKPRLERLTKLPTGMKSLKILLQAKRYLDTPGLFEKCSLRKYEVDNLGRNLGLSLEMVCVTKPSEVLDHVLEALSTSIPYLPSHVVYYLKCLFVARGVSKALSIYEESVAFHTHISKIYENMKILLHQYHQLRKCGEQKLNYKALVEDYSIQANIDMNIKLLDGCASVLSSINACMGKMIKDPYQRLFVGSNLETSNELAYFAPAGFLSEMVRVTSSGNSIVNKYQRTMFEEISAKSWPPQSSDRPGICGRCKCRKCNAKVGSMWINPNLNICVYCEHQIRNRNLVVGPDEKKSETMPSVTSSPACPFKGIGCKLPRAYCFHANRCFSCDRWSCPECNLVRGDGMVVENIVGNIVSSNEDDVHNVDGDSRIILGGIFLDFDRTLCSTKSGASPLPNRQKKSHTKGSQRKNNVPSDHTLDHGLLNLIAKYPSLVHIVTRNSHVEDIRTFLDINNVPKSVKIRSVKVENTTKGLVIKSILEQMVTPLKNLGVNDRNEYNGNEKLVVIGVFVDDDIKEHMHVDMINFQNEKLQSDSMHVQFDVKRVLFTRSVYT